MTAAKILILVVLAAAFLAVLGLAVVYPQILVLLNKASAETDANQSSNNSATGQLQTPPDCFGIEMVWQGMGRREPYDYSADLCAGYRCLNGTEISPSCLNYSECADCDGACISIPEMREKCQS